jgi:hypothetical protein
MGSGRYPDTRSLLITADCLAARGGRNGSGNQLGEFFYASRALCIGLRMTWPHGNMAEAQRLQDSPGAAFIHHQEKARGSRRSRNRERTTPSSAISGPWRTQQASCASLRPTVLGAHPRHVDGRTGHQCLAHCNDHPVTQRLPIHAAGLGSLSPAMTFQHKRKRQQPSRDRRSQTASAMLAQ